MPDMGTFRIDIDLESPAASGIRRRVERLLVDSGSMLTWVPAPVLDALEIVRERERAFRQASGIIVMRWVGTSLIHAGGTFMLDEVVFGEPNDPRVLGWRTLSGLNLIFDPASRRCVDAGPVAAGVAALPL